MSRGGKFPDRRPGSSSNARRRADPYGSRPARTAHPQEDEGGGSSGPVRRLITGPTSNPTSLPAGSSPALGRAPQAHSSPTVDDIANNVITANSANTVDRVGMTRAQQPTGDGPASSTSGSAATTDADAAPVTIWRDSLQEGVRQMRMLYVNLKNGRATPEVERRMKSVRVFLFHLEHEVEASRELCIAGVDRLLAYIRDNGADIYPEPMRQKCADLFEAFEADNWGANPNAPAPPAISPGVTQNNAPAPSPSLGALDPDTSGTIDVRQPPPDHPIWGINGIMHGFVYRRGQQDRFVPVVNPFLVHLKRDARVYGHNGLRPGDWWPLQKVAHFYGAHGAPVAGISGSADHGAYSIVVSGNSVYHDIDVDRGDELWYSADGSASSREGSRVINVSGATRSLQRSRVNQRPVRVLRSAGRTGAYAPLKGIRYDGLYVVVGEAQRINDSGGMYLCFHLRRQGGQTPLSQIVGAVPSPQQLADESRIRQGY